MQRYCVKCKRFQEVNKLRRGRYKCLVCGTIHKITVEVK